MDVCGQNAVRFVPTRTGMCGLPDRGGRGGEIFRTIKPSPLALPLNFVPCILSGNRAGGGGGCLWAERCTICSNPHKNVRATRPRWERRGNFPDYEALTPGPPPEFCIVCFVRQPGRGRGWMFVGSVCCDLSLAAQECAGYEAAVGEEVGGSWD